MSLIASYNLQIESYYFLPAAKPTDHETVRVVVIIVVVGNDGVGGGGLL